MGHHLPDKLIGDLLKLAANGEGVRSISRILGISKNTVARYYPKDTPDCKCGAPANHRGWCKARYAKSHARQAFHAARSGKTVVLPPTITISRMSSRKRTIARWLGAPLAPIPTKLSYAEMYGAIGEAVHAAKRVALEFREDVISEVTVAACEGRVHRDEIPAAIKFFYMRLLRPNYDHFSLDDVMTGTSQSRYEVFFIAGEQNDYPEEN